MAWRSIAILFCFSFLSTVWACRFVCGGGKKVWKNCRVKQLPCDLYTHPGQRDVERIEFNRLHGVVDLSSFERVTELLIKFPSTEQKQRPCDSIRSTHRVVYVNHVVCPATPVLRDSDGTTNRALPLPVTSPSDRPAFQQPVTPVSRDSDGTTDRPLPKAVTKDQTSSKFTPNRSDSATVQTVTPTSGDTTMDRPPPIRLPTTKGQASSQFTQDRNEDETESESDESDDEDMEHVTALPAAESSMSSESEDEPPCKKRCQVKRRNYVKTPWTKEEKSAVHNELRKCFAMKVLPKKLDCENVIRKHHCLKRRTWTMVKGYVRTTLASLERKKLK